MSKIDLLTGRPIYQRQFPEGFSGRTPIGADGRFCGRPPNLKIAYLDNTVVFSQFDVVTFGPCIAYAVFLGPAPEGWEQVPDNSTFPRTI